MSTRQTIGQQAGTLRVSARGIQPLVGMPLVSGSRQFGQQICDRHAHAPRCAIHLSETILRPTGITFNAVHYHTTLQLKPALSLTVLDWREAVSPVVTPSLRLPTSHLAVPGNPMTPAAFTLQRMTQPERVVEQIEVRNQRVERMVNTTAVISTRQTQQVVRQQREPTQDVPLVVVKSLPRAVQQAIAESSPRTSVPRVEQPSPHPPTRTGLELYQEPLMPPRVGQSMTPGMAPQSLSATDVNRLTDQVMQAIDRRLIAHRERMGRM